MAAVRENIIEAIAITDSELTKFASCEEKIEKGFKTFYEVGQALLTIRDERLYRADYSTFETYCVKRWGMSGRRAYQLIDASDVFKNVNNCSQTPKTESQARPLTQLETPEEQREAWIDATEKAEAEGRKVTAKDVQEAVDERKAKPGKLSKGAYRLRPTEKESKRQREMIMPQKKGLR